MRRFAACLTVLGALVIVGCGAGGTGSPTASKSTPTPVSISKIPIPQISTPTLGASTLQACTAVSAATAAQVVGVDTVSPLVNTNAGPISECIYSDATSGAGLVVLIEQVQGVVAATVMQAAIAQATHGGSGQDQPVSGLGDQALKNVESDGATVAFVKGATLVVVGASGTKRAGTAIEPDIEAICHQLAGQL